MEMMFSDAPAILYDACCGDLFAGHDHPLQHAMLMMEYVACSGLTHRIHNYKATLPVFPDFLE